ncbi:hypothetical protein JCM10213v2_009207 [Rhodosporidiobolus nylandii]
MSKALLKSLGLDEKKVNALLNKMGVDKSLMQGVYNRADGIENPCVPFGWLSAHLNFEQYNQLVFEPWLKASYFDQPPRPFTDNPLGDRHYSPYCDPYQLAQSEQIREAALMYSRILRAQDVMSGLQGISRTERWVAMSEKEREQVLLTIFEDDTRQAEKVGAYLPRCECPELTLDLAKAGGERMLSLLVNSLTVPANLPVDDLPPLPTNAAWDSLHRVGKFEPTTPFSKAKRAFQNLSVAWRAKGLYLFCLNWLSVMDGKGVLPTSPLARPPLPLNEQTAPALASLASKKRFEEIKNRSSGVGAGKPQCAACNQSAGDGVKLLCCSRCKGAGRMVWYCSSEHQRQSYHTHKGVCGTPVGSHPSTTGLPTSEVVRHPEQGLEPGSFLHALGPKSVKTVYGPDGEILFSSVRFSDFSEELDAALDAGMMRLAAAQAADAAEYAAAMQANKARAKAAGGAKGSEDAKEGARKAAREEETKVEQDEQTEDESQLSHELKEKMQL